MMIDIVLGAIIIFISGMVAGWALHGVLIRPIGKAGDFW